MIPFSSKLAVSEDVMIRQVGDETVLLDLKSMKYMGLDDVSTRMWQLLTASDSIQSAYDALMAEFEVEPEQLRKDLGEYVQQLLNLGLVQLKQQ